MKSLIDGGVAIEDLKMERDFCRGYESRCGGTMIFQNKCCCLWVLRHAEVFCTYYSLAVVDFGEATEEEAAVMYGEN